MEVNYENWRGLQLVQYRVQLWIFISEVLNDCLTFADKLLMLETYIVLIIIIIIITIICRFVIF
jgi:hypothetical protein